MIEKRIYPIPPSFLVLGALAFTVVVLIALLALDSTLSPSVETRSSPVRTLPPILPLP